MSARGKSFLTFLTQPPSHDLEPVDYLSKFNKLFYKITLGGIFGESAVVRQCMLDSGLQRSKSWEGCPENAPSLKEMAWNKIQSI